MWSKREKKRILALLLSILLLSGCGQAPRQEELPESTAQQEETVHVIDPAALSKPAGEKTETVYAKAQADGTVDEISVEVLLSALGDAPLVRDMTTLEDIRNTVGDEEFLHLPDGSLLWENQGEDIHYKGTSGGELPVTLHITYWLDGQEIAPDALAGKSGELRMRFAYQNHTGQEVTVNGETVSVSTPFAALTLAVLPGEHFANVEVTNGRVMDLDGEQAVIGFALPGLSECLSLTDYEPTQELKLPDYLEVRADVSDFALDFTATVLTPGLMEDLEWTDLDDLDELRKDMTDLQDATDELTDGVGELAYGAETFGGYLRKYTNGVGQLSDGASAMATGLRTLNDQVTGLQTRMEEIKKTLEQLTPEEWKQLLDRLGRETLTLSDGTEVELSEVYQAAENLIQEEAALLTCLSQMQLNLAQWQTYADETAAYAGRVEELLNAVPANLTVQANQTAQAQVEAALDGLGLSEEDRDAVIASVDVTEVTAAAEEVYRSLAALSAPVSPEGFPEAASIRTLTEQITGHLTLLQAAAQALQQQTMELSEMEELIKALTALTGIDVGGINPAGLQQLTEGIKQLSSGANALRDGVKALDKAGGALNEGYGELLDGMDMLREAVKKYNREGITELTDLTGESYQTLVRQLRALKQMDEENHSFTGLDDGTKGSVRYIIETDGIGT